MGAKLIIILNIIKYYEINLYYLLLLVEKRIIFSKICQFRLFVVTL